MDGDGSVAGGGEAASSGRSRMMLGISFGAELAGNGAAGGRSRRMLGTSGWLGAGGGGEAGSLATGVTTGDGAAGGCAGHIRPDGCPDNAGGAALCSARAGST